MSNGSPGSWVDKAIGAAFGLLLAAMALWGAVQLIRSVWVWLCLILAVAGVVTAGVLVLRRHHGRW